MNPTYPSEELTIHEVDAKGDMEFSIGCKIEDDIWDELEEFASLVRQGLFDDAHNFFEANLREHQSMFEVFVDYVECLHDQGFDERIPSLLEKQASKSLATEEQALVDLLYALLHIGTDQVQSLKTAREWHSTFPAQQEAGDVEVCSCQIA